MYDKNNIFAKILRKEIPCKSVYEDDHVLFFHDINPLAKIHILGVPKKNVVSFSEFVITTDPQTIKYFFNKITEVIKDFPALFDRLMPVSRGLIPGPAH